MSKFLIIIIGAIIACATITIQGTSAEPYPFADNVCNRSVPVRRDIIIEKPVQYEIKVQSMCGILPCTKTRIETRHDQTIKSLVVHEYRTTCCDGYAETPARQCAPICLESCTNGGKCVAPNVCKCSPEPSDSAPGYVGPTCKRFACLASQRWGASCERECPTQCSPNSYCSADTGKCLCYPGWHGPECALECEPDSDADDCQEHSGKMPPIMEPEANLIASGNQIVTSRSQQQRAQALVLDENEGDARQTTNEGQAWANIASSYLIGVLGLMSLIFLAAFLIVKRRYEFVRNELYYASAASAVSSRSRSGPGSDYSSNSSGDSASYYSAAASPGRPGSGDDLEKNQSFATATRNILSGVVAGIGGGASPGKHANELGESKNKLLLFTPRVESHLIRSQKEAEQNIYSEIDLANTVRNSRAVASSSAVANRARAQTPVRQQPAQPAPEDDIYSVPKSPVVSKSGDNNKPHDTSLEMGYYDDNDSNPIYEEIKPRGGDVNGKQ